MDIRVDFVPTAERALANTTPELATREGLATAAELVGFYRPPDIANLANGEDSVVIAKQRSEDSASTTAVTANVEHGYRVELEPIIHCSLRPVGSGSSGISDMMGSTAAGRLCTGGGSRAIPETRRRWPRRRSRSQDPSRRHAAQRRRRGWQPRTASRQCKPTGRREVDPHSLWPVEATPRHSTKRRGCLQPASATPERWPGRMRHRRPS